MGGLTAVVGELLGERVKDMRFSWQELEKTVVRPWHRASRLRLLFILTCQPEKEKPGCSAGGPSGEKRVERRPSGSSRGACGTGFHPWLKLGVLCTQYEE